MQVPVIVSASRSTDIPAFYADWFFHRLKVGYSAWTNPFNGVKGYVSYKNTRFIVFWSKNPRPLLPYLDQLDLILIMTVDSFARDDDTEADKVEPLEEVIDDLTKEIKNHHVDRLQAGICRPELGILLTDYLTNCERVSDHCSNVAVCIIQTRNSSFETHSYLNELKNGNEPEFVDEFIRVMKGEA